VDLPSSLPRIPTTQVLTMSPLSDTLSFKHDALVRAFATKYKLSLDSSEELFGQMLQWLWFLTHRNLTHPPQHGFPTFPAQAPLDIYWHEFILDTRAYQHFCTTHLGEFLHHCPTPEGLLGASHKLFLAHPQQQREIIQVLLKNAMHEVHAAMGLETMLSWYVHLHAKYPQLVPS
jgi:hypothetical protein